MNCRKAEVIAAATESRKTDRNSYGRTLPEPADIGLPTGNGKKLSYSQAQLGQATCLAVA